MDYVSDYGGSVLRKDAADSSPFPTTSVLLGAKGFHVIHDVGPNDAFKLIDVMVGPLFFQNSAGEIGAED